MLFLVLMFPISLLFQFACLLNRVNSFYLKWEGVQEEPFVFQFVPVASESLTEQHQKEPGSVIFASSIQVFIDTD